jgi:hypothetical protein
MARTRLYAAALTVPLLLPPTDTLAQGAAPAEKVVLTSFSGGISKGSYQGGVDYAISEYLRRQRDPAFRASIARLVPDAAAALPALTLGAATGASAGNINALLASISWCTATIADRKTGARTAAIAPEQSLFWSTWVNTGFTQMLPEKFEEGEAREAAVLSRLFFDKVRKEGIKSFADQATFHQCNVPLGVTLTRASPVKVTLVDGRGSANVQRFATVLNVKTAPRAGDGGGLRLAFEAPPRLVDTARSLGALALLRELEPGRPDTGWVRLDTLFKAVLASSSFPVAFAAVEIRYRPGGLARETTPADSARARFYDGGLFDNNPFGLALRLYELNAVARGDTIPRVAPVAVVYSNPNRYRGSFEKERRNTTQQRDDDGLAGVRQMLGGAWSAATEYELQSLARQISRDNELGLEKANVRGAAKAKMYLSSRSAPIMGEQLSSFGAFLGRAFREYDFYTGLYDGLEFVARNFVCASQPGADQPPKDAVAAEVARATEDACTRRVHLALTDRNVFGIDDLAAEVLSWHRAVEYPDHRPVTDVTNDQRADGNGASTTRTLAGDDLTPRRRTLLAGIHHAMSPLRTKPFEQECTRRNDPIASRLCVTRLDEVLERLADDEQVKEAAQSLAEWCDAKGNADAKQHGECTADKEFAALVRSPRKQMHRLVERALTNLQDAEDSIKDRPGDEPQHSAWVEAAFMQYRAASFRYRTGFRGKRFEVNPSTV